MSPSSPTPAPPTAAAEHLHAAFLELLPTVRRIARGYFRGVPCSDRRDDLVAEAVALGWLWFLRLAARQKDPAEFLTRFAYTLARAANCGRRLCGSERATDPLSRTCRARRGFAVCSLHDDTATPADVFDDALRDNTRTPVPAQVQLRLDFPRWRRSLPVSRRRMADALARGLRTTEAAARFRVSPARVSQVRRELYESWRAFCGDAAHEPAGGGAH